MEKIYVFFLHLQEHYKFQENRVHHCCRNLEGSQQYGVICWFAQLGWSIFRIHPLRNLKVLRKHIEEDYARYIVCILQPLTIAVTTVSIATGILSVAILLIVQSDVARPIGDKRNGVETCPTLIARSTFARTGTPITPVSGLTGWIISIL